MQTARTHLESLLKARKLDVTLTSASPLHAPALRHDAARADDLAVTGVPALDAALGGGLPRGHLSEIVGGRSSGRTSVVCRALGAAASRDELVAFVDSCDRFDPASAAAVGLDLSRLLWIRETGDATRALKAMNLVLQAGGFGVVAIDLADVPLMALKRIPFTTWLRVQRTIEGSDTACVLVAPEPLARSAGGVTLSLAAAAQWAGHSDRSRRLGGLDLTARIVSPRRRVQGDVRFIATATHTNHRGTETQRAEYLGA